VHLCINAVAFPQIFLECHYGNMYTPKCRNLRPEFRGNSLSLPRFCFCSARFLKRAPVSFRARVSHQEAVGLEAFRSQHKSL
jgi:hypothetical protein